MRRWPSCTPPGTPTASRASCWSRPARGWSAWRSPTRTAGGVAELRRAEPWFPDAFAAFERIWSGEATDDDWAAITPFTYGRWDDAARSQDARGERLRNAEAAALYYADGAIDTAAVRSALAGLEAPVLLVAGEYDVALPPDRAVEYAGLFPSSRLAVQPGGGHFPWLDDPGAFVRSVVASSAETGCADTGGR